MQKKLIPQIGRGGRAGQLLLSGAESYSAVSDIGGRTPPGLWIPAANYDDVMDADDVMHSPGFRMVMMSCSSLFSATSYPYFRLRREQFSHFAKNTVTSRIFGVGR